MKRYLLLGLLAGLTFYAGTSAAYAREAKPVMVSDLELVGEIEGENISFALTLNADVDKRRSQLALVSGDVAYLGGELPRKAELSREQATYMIEFGRSGEQDVEF
ncbi:MAG: hypothetical protein QGH42_09000, partial [Kiritimatiellia bacterium]|nr:hypothetical protein [Kiritimatiellia bacterium]